MQIFHTFFKKEIFAEIGVPNKLSGKVLIICNGVPSVPSKRTLMEFFVKKNYWVVHLRYRGSWESKGIFLKKSLEQDLIDVIDELPKGFTDLWTKKKFNIIPKKIIITGSSFGGPAVILASRDPRVTRAIAFSPVVDWKAPSKEEPMPQYIRFMQEAYGEVYRTNLWHKLGKRGFYGPSHDIDPKKLVIVHAKDDKIVRLKEVREFAKKSNAKLLLLKKGGHMSSSAIMAPSLWKKLKKSF